MLIYIYFIWLDKEYLDTPSKGKQWLREEEEEAPVLNHIQSIYFVNDLKQIKQIFYNDISIK